MALIMCRECEKEISDQASACPQCGCPVKRQKTAAPAKVKPTAVLTSRWALLFRGSITSFIFPKNITLDGQNLRTSNVRFFLFPWLQHQERMTARQIASIRHAKGLIWDKIVIETSGGSNDLDIDGLRKRDAKALLAALEAFTA